MGGKRQQATTSDLLSDTISQVKGLVYVFTGEGKGKTSAALGTALRAVGAGMRVGWVAWYKQESWGMGEIVSLRKLGVEVRLMGKGFHIPDQNSKNVGQDPVADKRRAGALQARDDLLDSKSSSIDANEVKIARVGKDGVVVDTATEDEHLEAALTALREAENLIGKVDVLILDEVNNAVKDGLLQASEVAKVIGARKQTHLILTGRDAAKEIIAMADLVTEMKKLKHPYDGGKLAVRGLDF